MRGIEPVAVLDNFQHGFAELTIELSGLGSGHGSLAILADQGIFWKSRFSHILADLAQGLWSWKLANLASHKNLLQTVGFHAIAFDPNPT